MLLNRNQVYCASVQLAVLDHNAHVEREVAKNKKGEQIYHRKYCKQTKKWDITPTKQIKEYSYAIELMDTIMAERKSSCAPLKRRRPVDDDSPTNIQATIAHTAPIHTQDIVNNKRSRFYN